jgi:hypothetical protein
MPRSPDGRSSGTLPGPNLDVTDGITTTTGGDYADGYGEIPQPPPPPPPLPQTGINSRAGSGSASREFTSNQTILDSIMHENVGEGYVKGAAMIVAQASGNAYWGAWFCWGPQKSATDIRLNGVPIDSCQWGG